MADQYRLNDPLVNVYFQTDAEKKALETGLKIAQTFYRKQTGDESSLNFFRGRNARWIELMLWRKGSQNMKEFLDYMNVSDANKAYVKMDMTQQRIAPQFVGTLIESMAKNTLYPCVTAIDDGSMSAKQQRMFDALFRMHDQETIADLSQQAGIAMEPQNAYVPHDELSAKVYFELEDRLPKEIRFEKKLYKTLSDIKFDRILSRKGLDYLITLNLESVKIDKVADGQYIPRLCVPTNMVYNFFINDNGECQISTIGEFTNTKVKDFRAKYGKSDTNPNGLTEEEIFNFAKLSTTRNNGIFNLLWNHQWGNLPYNMARPYDDYSLYCLDFEIDCGEDVYAVEKKDAYGKSNIQEKKGIPYSGKGQVKPDDVNIIKTKKNTWMRGVYAPYIDKMLYWGQPDMIISPYTNYYKSMSSYSINIPNNDGEYVPSLFERILEPLREYTLVKLKRKQMIAKIVPDGIRIDVESARNTDLGDGNTIAWEEVLRIYDQTGTEVYSSKGINPNEPAAPAISNTVQRNTIQKIVELTNVLASIVQEIRQLIGVPIYRDGGDLGERTAAKLAEGQNQSSFNVTDFISNSHMQVWEEVCYKLTCLYWNDVVKNEPESRDDLLDTEFDVSIKMKSTEYEKQILDRDIQTWSQVLDANGHPLIRPKDAFKLRNIENNKLAELYLANTVEENEQRAQADKQRAEQANIQAQQQSAQLAAQEAQKMQADKLQAEKDMEEFRSTKKKEEILLDGILQIAKMGMPIPPQFASLVQALVPNIGIPLAMENMQMQQQVTQAANIAMQQQQQAAQAQQTPPSPMGPQPDQQQQAPPQEQQDIQQPQIQQ